MSAGEEERAKGHEEPLEVEELKGSLRLSSGGFAPAFLCLLRGGLELRDHSNPTPEHRIDVLSATPLRYVEGRIQDGLVIGERELPIGIGRGAAVRRLLALARLGPDAEREIRPSPFVEEPTELGRRWLKSWLEEGETLLVFIRADHKSELPSALGPPQWAEPCLVLTERRAALVAIGDLGDLKIADLPPRAVTVAEGFGRRAARIGEHQLWVDGARAKLLAELGPLPTMSPAERLVRLAMLHERRERSSGAELLREAERAGSAAAGVLLGLREALDEAAEAPPPPALAAFLGAFLDATDPAGAAAALLSLRADFGLSGEEETRLLRSCRALSRPEAQEAALALHLEIHRVRSEGERSLEAELELADHLAERGERERARELLEALLTRLPSEELLELLPDEAADLSEGGEQRARVAVLERLASVRGEEGSRHGPTLAELARLEPLVPSRLRELAEEGGEVPAAARVRRYGEALKERRWSDPASRPDAAPLGPLPEALLRSKLRHPAAREGHALGALQGLLAEVEVPDSSALRAFCETIARADAITAAEEISQTLGLPKVEIFVSRGAKSLGLRSFEGEEPFLVIGGDHLDPARRAYLGEAELRFALATELAHLRFGHSRVTSSEVWLGALSKGKAGFDAIAGFLPGWRALKVAEKLSSVVSFYQDGKAGWALRKLERWTGISLLSGGSAHKSSLGNDPEDWIAAARVMQLTADRAGLLFVDDLHAAIRAICLSHEGYHEVLRRADESSMSQVLRERDEGGKIRRQSLALRVAALISFHLSEDYRELREPTS